ncbi:MAG: Biotin synthase [Syntrophorhabdus sp. PtaU1.Bin153]|nr:MAG: Biotin synthase [Syntrophorhabdus sp. PtaU1.Bin153]
MEKTATHLEYTKETALRFLTMGKSGVEGLYGQADTTRREHMGDDVYIRGIIEFSNVCANNCLYCGIRAGNRKVRRYTLSADEIIETASAMATRHQMTVVLQAGESPAFGDDLLGGIIRRIKKETPLSVTVSVGNRSRETYRYWKECGMDRYFLRFETSDPGLFLRLHPGSTLEERLRCLGDLQDLGIQTGSGFMIGLPGETLNILAQNILLCRELDLDMIGIGPFIPHPDTPLGEKRNVYNDNPEMFFKALAVLRIFNPDAHIPATTAYDALFPEKGRDLALQRGANIFMPNNTPACHRKDYLLYPDKPGVDDPVDQYLESAVSRIRALGRKVGEGPGHSIKKRKALTLQR